MANPIKISDSLQDVRYEIRGQLAQRAHEMERQGYEIVSLNIGNPGLFGFRTPETIRMAMIENLQTSEAYCHQKGIFPARESPLHLLGLVAVITKGLAHEFFNQGQAVGTVINGKAGLQFQGFQFAANDIQSQGVKGGDAQARHILFAE